MNRTAKIAAIIIAAIAVILTAMYFLSIYKSYDEAKKILGSHELTYTEWTRYDTAPTDGVQTISYGSVSLTVPQELHKRAKGITREEWEASTDEQKAEYTYSDTMFFVENEDGKASDYLILFHGEGHGDLLPTLDGMREEEFYKVFLRKMGKEKVETEYDYYDLLYSLDMDKFRDLTSDEARLFNRTVSIRNYILPDACHRIYRFENEYFNGFLQEMSDTDDNGDTFVYYFVTLYPKADPEKEIEFTLRSVDEDVGWIMNSARLTTEE